VIEEEQYNIALKDEKINAENFALSIKLMGSTPLPVTKERKEIIDAAARIILILKRKGRATEVKEWVAFLMTQFQFLNTRNVSKEINSKSLETELYNRIKELENAK
jgi:hypothetical protein